MVCHKHQHGGSILGSFFARNISTNSSTLGQLTHLKPGELSSLFIFYNIIISWLNPLNGFDYFYFALCVHWSSRYQSFSTRAGAWTLSACPSYSPLDIYSWQRYEHPVRMSTLIYYLHLIFHLHFQAGNSSWPRPAKTCRRRNFYQRLLYKNQARARKSES